MNNDEINNVASPTAPNSLNGDFLDKFDFRKHTHVGVRTAAFSKIKRGLDDPNLMSIPRDQPTLAFTKSILSHDKKTA